MLLPFEEPSPFSGREQSTPPQPGAGETPDAVTELLWSRAPQRRAPFFRAPPVCGGPSVWSAILRKRIALLAFWGALMGNGAPGTLIRSMVHVLTVHAFDECQRGIGRGWHRPPQRRAISTGRWPPADAGAPGSPSCRGRTI